MRHFTFTVLAVMLGLVSYGSVAAEQMNTAITVSVQTAALSGDNHLSSSSTGNMDEKAVPDGSRTYPATSVSGQHNLHSTSVVYD
jgi:hypothetical protein